MTKKIIQKNQKEDNLTHQKEKYELTWKGKNRTLERLNEESSNSLKLFKGESYNLNKSNNLLIQGDNLEVLKLLQKTHLDQIKMVYIDPPYNTGQDFVYNDNYKDNTKTYDKSEIHGKIHANWLSMMYPRLVLARKLLREDGVIAIHIDEHEYSNLQLILNEIFGEENDLGTIIWDKGNPKGDSKGIAYQHESILVFAKNKRIFSSKCKLQRNKNNAEEILNKAGELFSRIGTLDIPDELKILRKKYGINEVQIEKHFQKCTLETINKEFASWIKKQVFSPGEKAYSFIDEEGDVYRPVSMAWPNKRKAADEYFIPLIHPITKKACPIPARGWRNPPSRMKKLLEDKRVLFGKDELTQPNRKYLLRENMKENVPSIITYKASDDQLLARLEITFENPKPVKFIKDLLQPFINNQDIVLDFFAGSGSTGHAILEMNKEKVNNCSFILVQRDEKTDERSEAFKKGFESIFHITRERILRAIIGTENHIGIGGGFEVFKISEDL